MRDAFRRRRVTAARELPCPYHSELEMEFCRVLVEAHARCATIYIAGILADQAAIRTEEVIRTLKDDTNVVRIDLRAVNLIDPESFVRIARTLNDWRDAHGANVTIEFPKRSQRSERRHLRLVDQPITSGMAVSTAIN
jgi:hypothetical protein